MLDLFTVIDKGGIVLWQKQLAPVSSAIVNGLITDVFIAGSSVETYSKSGYTVKWTMANDLGLIFIAVYQSLLQLGFVEEFLENMKKILLKLHGSDIKDAQSSGADVSKIVCNFDHYFDQRLTTLETKGEVLTQTQTSESPVVEPEPETRSASPRVLTAAKLAGGRRVSKKGSGRTTPVSVPSSDDESKKPTKTKVQRKWRADGTVDDSGNDVLDFSTSNVDSEDVNLDEFIGTDQMESRNGRMLVKELDTFQEAEPKSAFSFFSTLVAGKPLTNEDLAPAMESMRQHLLAKNIANEVCNSICDSVRTSLIGQKVGTFSKTSTIVREAIESSLRRILTPTTSLDLLNDVSRSPKPYTISFIGVNGVGKSTNLSKVAYWLLSNNLRVLIVACDTFRSGAVEQLRVHVTRLQKLLLSQGKPTDGIQLFERGYGKDPASIANDAIKHAQKEQVDVVLIDTAGRRHNDARLMAGLERFVSTVRIDKIFQVAEALVGTDSISQARHFNDALGRRNLDGFVISKVDTVGDAVGTLVSMIYVTGVPVVFVGVGQMYTDLRGLSVQWVLQMLLS